MANSLEQTGNAQYVQNIDIKDSFNVGGHLNHELFWDSLCPIKEGGGKLPSKNSNLGTAISISFESTENMFKIFEEMEREQNG